MRTAYANGGTGAIASATAWTAATAACLWFSPTAAVLALFVAGIAIFPLSVVLSKLIGRSGSPAGDNPLTPLAVQGTFWMLMMFPITFALALYKVEWFFPAMLLIIGGRYLTFQTLYGLRMYLAFGVALALAAVAVVLSGAPLVSGAAAGALIEFVFGFALLAGSQNSDDLAAP